MDFFKKIEELKNCIGATDLDNIRRKMQQFKELADNEWKCCSCQEAINYIEYLVKELNRLFRISNGYDFQQEAVNLWKEEKISVFKIISETPDFWDGDIDLKYTEDMDKNIRNLARDMINTITVGNPGLERAIREGRLNQEQRIELERVVNITLQECGKYWNKQREEMYNQSLYAICTFLGEIGGLKRYLDTHNLRMSELEIQELQLNYDQEKGKELLNRVTDLLDIDVIRKLDLYRKKVLLAFYSNRATKELEGLMTILFIFSKAGDIQGANELDDETLTKLILEEKFLSIIWKKEIKKFREGIEQNLLIKKEDILTKSSEELARVEIDESIFEEGIDVSEFERYFGTGSFEEDKKIIIPYSKMLSRIYRAKDWSMETLIYLVIKEEKGLKIKNWGYIPEINKKGENSIESQAENILVGIDFPRYNMPVRLHINRERLLSIVNQTLGNTKIPVYKGHEDFSAVRLNGRRRYMGTSILMPIQKEQRKAIEMAVTRQKDNPNYNCIAHLNWLAYPNRMPEHLQGETQKEVDLATGAISLVGVDVGDTDGR